MRNILLITVRSDIGGGPKHVDQIIDGLCHNHNIYVASPKSDDYGKKWVKSKVIKAFIEIPYRSLSFKHLLKIREFVRANNIEIIHSHGNGAGVYSRVLKILQPKVKVIHTFHGITSDYEKSLKRILNCTQNFIFKYFTDRSILVSNGELKIAKKLKYINDKKYSVIYNGVKEPSENKMKTDKFNIVTLSRFDYQKNMNSAFEIANKLRAYDDINFIWIGNGPDYPLLKKKNKIEKLNIDFVGFTHKPFKYLALGDLYLSTSRFEGLPYALIEAQSIGLPIICTDVVGNNEIVSNGQNGFLFNNIGEAVSLIIRMYHNPSLINKLSKESKKNFKNNYSFESMIQSIDNIYKNL